MVTQNTEILSAEATIHLTAELDATMQNRFPFVDGVNDMYKKYVNGHQDAPVFVSFSDALPPESRIPLIVRSLENASDPDNPAFCEHGSAHATFYEAIDALKTHVSEFQADHRWGALDLTDLVRTDDGRTKRRFLIETPLFPRISVRPKPFLEANTLAKSTNTIGSTAKHLRRMGALDADHMGAAMLTAAFMKLPPEETLAVFGNTEYRMRLLAAKFPKSGLLLPNNPEHVRLVKTVYETLTLPTSSGRVLNYDPDAYKKAVTSLEENHFVQPGAIFREPFHMTKTQDSAFARAVFASAEEKAHRVAPLELTDPAKTRYIDTHYGKRVTTDLITAYVLIPRFM